MMKQHETQKMRKRNWLTSPLFFEYFMCNLISDSLYTTSIIFPTRLSIFLLSSIFSYITAASACQCRQETNIVVLVVAVIVVVVVSAMYPPIYMKYISKAASQT
jgi:hypothetical protein